VRVRCRPSPPACVALDAHAIVHAGRSVRRCRGQSLNITDHARLKPAVSPRIPRAPPPESFTSALLKESLKMSQQQVRTCPGPTRCATPDAPACLLVQRSCQPLLQAAAQRRSGTSQRSAQRTCTRRPDLGIEVAPRALGHRDTCTCGATIFQGLFPAQGQEFKIWRRRARIRGSGGVCSPLIRFSTPSD